MHGVRCGILVVLCTAAAGAVTLDPWWADEAPPSSRQLGETIRAAGEIEQADVETIWRRLFALGQSEQAAKFLRSARRQSLDKRRSAFVLHQLALLHANLRQHDRFLAYADSALAQLQAAAVADSIELGMLGLSRASALAELDRREASLEQLSRARALLRRQLADDDPRQFRIRLIASICLSNLGEFAQAAELQRANLRELLLAEEVPPLQLGFSYNNLGVSLHGMGDMAGAREAWQHALSTMEGVDGPHPPYAATTWLNLATVELQVGRTEEAREALSHSMDLYQASGRAPDLLLVGALNALGSSFLATGDLASAGQWLLAARRASHEVQPDNDLTLIALRHSLGRLHLRRGEADSAVAVLREALRLEATRSQHVLALRPMLHRELGRSLRKLGELEAARAAFESAREELQAQYPERDMLLFQIELDLLLLEPNSTGKILAALDRLAQSSDARLAALEVASTLREQGELDTAFAVAEKALARAAEAARSMTQLMGEEEALLHMRALHELTDLLIAILDEAPSEPRLRGAFEAVAQTRGLVQDEMLRRQRLRQATTGEELDRAWRELAESRAVLDYWQNAAWDAHAWEARERELRLRVERAELRCAVLSREESESPPPPPSLADIQRALGPRRRLISFVRWLEGGVPHYGTFLVDVQELRWQRLGAAEPIDAQIEALRGHMRNAARQLRLEPARTELEARELLREIAELVWRPLELESGGDLWIVPDDRLHLIPFAALPGEREEYLIEECDSLHRLVSESEILRNQRPNGNRGLLLIADPDDELPGGRRELAAIAQLAEQARIQPISRADDRIDEAGLRERARGRSVLHFAAHGDPGRARGLLPRGAIRLAGCSGGSLDALELSSFPLDGVSWCVLSSCLSGDGDSWPGEGVLGLQRALRSAGAHTLFVSLWPLEDRFAQELMAHLYAQRWIEGASTAESLSRARRLLLADLRERGWSTHPLRWASVIALGDWR